jgi:hypothetical protein
MTKDLQKLSSEELIRAVHANIKQTKNKSFFSFCFNVVVYGLLIWFFEQQNQDVAHILAISFLATIIVQISLLPNWINIKTSIDYLGKKIELSTC